MAVEIFLGEPPANIKQWIIEHAALAGHADTIITWQDDSISSYNWSGEISRNTIANESSIGWDDDADKWTWARQPKIVDIGTNISSLGNEPFNNCTNTNIIIPDSVTSISQYSLYGCGKGTITINKTKAQVEAMANKYWGLGVYFDHTDDEEIAFQVTIHCIDDDITFTPEL